MIDHYTIDYLSKVLVWLKSAPVSDAGFYVQELSIEIEGSPVAVIRETDEQAWIVELKEYGS